MARKQLSTWPDTKRPTFDPKRTLYRVSLVVTGGSGMTLSMWADSKQHALARCLTECGGEGSCQVLSIEQEHVKSTSSVVERQVIARATEDVIKELTEMGVLA